MKKHDQKVAIITGASGGIGEAIARRLAKEGAAVALFARSDTKQLVREIRDTGGAALGIPCDLKNSESIFAAMDEVKTHYGRCDILINNAGIYPRVPFESITLDMWREVFAVNVDAPFLLCKAVLPLMKASQYGRIINISSNAVWLSLPDMSHYMASKMALIGLTRALSTELAAFGITVNSVAPGLVRTTSTEQFTSDDIFHRVAASQPIQCTLEPDDIAGTVSFLASEDAAFITGQNLVVDGGVVRC